MNKKLILDFFLLDLVIANFYNIQMLTYSSSFKAKPKMGTDLTSNYATTLTS
jgi:hypothetical protein